MARRSRIYHTLLGLEPDPAFFGLLAREEDAELTAAFRQEWELEDWGAQGEMEG